MWKNDPDIFLTSGKDDMIIQHVFKDAKRPADLVVPAGIDISIDGNISHAYAEKHGTNRELLRASCHCMTRWGAGMQAC